MASGWVRSAISPTQSRSFVLVVGASAAMVWLIRRTLLTGLEFSYFDIGIGVDDLQHCRLLFAAGQDDRAIEGRARLDLYSGGTVDRGDLLPHRLRQVFFDSRLGLDVVDYRFPTAGGEEHCESQHDYGAGSGQQAHLSPFE